MPKRFTDTEKWKKPFIRGLEGPYKLLWFYILDDCDHAGIWQVDFEVARIRTGQHDLDYQKALNVFGDRVQPIEKFKWFIPDFISFQYGELSEKNRLHLSVIQILSKNKLDIKKNKGLISPLEGDKDKDKDKDKELEKDKEKYITVENEKIFDVMPMLEVFEAALNGRQREHGTRNWRDVVPEWFETVLEIDFNDGRHVFNTFSKYLINSKKPNGTFKTIPKVDLTDL